MKHKILAATGAAIALATLAPTAAFAQGDPAAAPTLADVLRSDSAGDTDGYDHNWHDYDIVTQAVLAFPDLTAAASDPAASLTAFLPNDAAFRRLVKEISGTRPKTEKEAFDAVVGLGLDTVKTVLTYHLIGSKLSYEAALQSNGATLTTLQTGTIEVKVRGKWCPTVRLIDADTDDRDPRVIDPNIGGEASNGFAHGIDRVLRPVDLP
jgi:uncharacterized surface protein with fasciclin (FAS1) repeats